VDGPFATELRRLDEAAKGEPLRELECPAPDAPSGRLALALMATGTTDLSRVPVRHSAAGSVDPRSIHGNPTIRAWEFVDPGDAYLARQAVPPPNRPVREAVEGLARRPYNGNRWWQESARAAQEIVPADAIDLVGAMVHPSPAPAGTPIWRWVKSTQIAAAFILARLDYSAGPSGRDTLIDVLNGPIDWVTEAVVIALREVALDRPDELDRIAGEFERVRNRIPVPLLQFAMTFLVLQVAYQRLPGRPKEQHNRFLETVNAFRESW
ncbi:MAG TPA: hypothetical protein VI893_00900, partial [Thermoplasmata archaeon]|nr:hypothetical protein [Thermoplasmata archaeon]